MIDRPRNWRRRLLTLKPNGIAKAFLDVAAAKAKTQQARTRRKSRRAPRPARSVP